MKGLLGSRPESAVADESYLRAYTGCSVLLSSLKLGSSSEELVKSVQKEVKEVFGLCIPTQ